jgi:hypothetical protein
MSLKENVSASFKLATAYNRLRYPATHDEAMAAVTTMVRQLKIICDQYGYDPAEWLNDGTAQHENSVPQTGNEHE